MNLLSFRKCQVREADKPERSTAARRLWGHLRHLVPRRRPRAAQLPVYEADQELHPKQSRDHLLLPTEAEQTGPPRGPEPYTCAAAHPGRRWAHLCLCLSKSHTRASEWKDFLIRTKRLRGLKPHGRGLRPGPRAGQCLPSPTSHLWAPAPRKKAAGQSSA